MKNISPNLSIREIWKLHLILKDARNDNVLEFIKGISPSTLVESLKIMYKRHPENMAVGFLNGLEKSGFFSFEELVKAIG